MTPAPERPRLRYRAASFDFSAVPRHWFADDAFLTHLSNGVNLLFPLGERFFVRSVLHYADRIDDPVLREQVRVFCAQEGRHAHEHEAQFEALERQGYRVRAFLRAYDTLAYDWLEGRMSPAMRLSVTVALEHYTALMARGGLEKRFLDHADETMRALLFWHAAEEIEHKAVAFEVLRKVAPSYALRISGLAIATAGLVGFWAAASAMLLAQDVRISGGTMRRRRLPGEERGGIAKNVFLAGIRDYLRPDFHPDDRDDLAIAHDYLRGVGWLDGATIEARTAGVI